MQPARPADSDRQLDVDRGAETASRSSPLAIAPADQPPELLGEIAEHAEAIASAANTLIREVSADRSEREARLLLELPDSLHGQEETYRLLIGVLLHERAELEQLRASTISSLAAYDAKHDTELLATLEAFLAHHGSTTDTAEAMSLHRHTVGYRLARVHEVSGLSPYESEGRERLSLGLKAAQVLAADERLFKSG